MHKHELFKEALKKDTYLKVAWVISAFSLIREGPDDWKKDPYLYRIVQTQVGHYYVNEMEELVKIEGTQPGQPVFRFLERIVLNPGDIENVLQETVTSVGTAYFNKAALGSIFAARIPYVNGKIDPGKIEQMINERMIDDPGLSKTDTQGVHYTPPTADAIYVSEYRKFVDTVFDMTNFSQLCTWGMTEKALLPPPGVEQKKAELVELYKDRLDDPAVVAIILKELVKFDAEYLKDDPSLNFLLSKKSREIVRSKLYLAYGAERNLSGSQKVDFIQSSLSQGWEIDKFPNMNDALRSGSFDRGSETQLGGVTFKEILRATSNIAITEDDCGSTVGREIFVDRDNLQHITGYSIVTPEGSKFIKTSQEAGAYLGQVVQKRSMMYCIAEGNRYCKTCAGFNLSSNPQAASMAAAAYGSAFLGMFMASMHGKVLSTKKLDWKRLIT